MCWSTQRKHSITCSLCNFLSYAPSPWNDRGYSRLHFQGLDQRPGQKRLPGLHCSLQRWSWPTESHWLDSGGMGKSKLSFFGSSRPLATQDLNLVLKVPSLWILGLIILWYFYMLFPFIYLLSKYIIQNQFPLSVSPSVPNKIPALELLRVQQSAVRWRWHLPKD